MPCGLKFSPPAAGWWEPEGRPNRPAALTVFFVQRRPKPLVKYRKVVVDEAQGFSMFASFRRPHIPCPGPVEQASQTTCFSLVGESPPDAFSGAKPLWWLQAACGVENPCRSPAKLRINLTADHRGKRAPWATAVLQGLDFLTISTAQPTTAQ